ncbi:MAG: hypothetical protein ACI4S3_05270 [Candidatus Gastranaerophilaceae bacterium]
MDSTRNTLDIQNDIIAYLKSIGIEVRTKTKALGHQGFFRVNRIDISREIKEERIIPTLLHEFAHYIIFNIKPLCKDMHYIFNEDSEIIHQELIKVTNFVDKNASLEKLYTMKHNVKQAISSHEKIIKTSYPNFKRNEKFKPFLKYSRHSDIKHLVKHDAVKVLSWFSYKTYSIMNIENEFPNTPIEFVAYLKLKSCQRKQASISRKINKLKKYYNEPTELFARFVEGLYIDINMVKELAPYTFNIFKQQYYNNYYPHLNNIFGIVNISL